MKGRSLRGHGEGDWTARLPVAFDAGAHRLLLNPEAPPLHPQRTAIGPESDWIKMFSTVVFQMRDTLCGCVRAYVRASVRACVRA